MGAQLFEQQTIILALAATNPELEWIILTKLCSGLHSHHFMSAGFQKFAELCAAALPILAHSTSQQEGALSFASTYEGGKERFQEGR